MGYNYWSIHLRKIPCLAPLLLFKLQEYDRKRHARSFRVHAMLSATSILRMCLRSCEHQACTSMNMLHEDPRSFLYALLIKRVSIFLSSWQDSRMSSGYCGPPEQHIQTTGVSLCAWSDASFTDDKLRWRSARDRRWFWSLSSSAMVVAFA